MEGDAGGTTRRSGQRCSRLAWGAAQVSRGVHGHVEQRKEFPSRVSVAGCIAGVPARAPRLRPPRALAPRTSVPTLFPKLSACRGRSDGVE